MGAPTVDLLCNGSLYEERNPAPGLGDPVLVATVTVGLIGYDAPDGRRFMIVDPGMTSDWPKIAGSMKRLGVRTQDVTHVLVTHWDEDHAQNLERFEGALAISAAAAHRVGTPYFGRVPSLYPDGRIEDPRIEFIVVSRGPDGVTPAHSRDETIFVIDSANEGRVAFVGDLLWAPITEVPVDAAARYDRSFTIDIVRKYIMMRELRDRYPDLRRIYAGHSRAPGLTAEEFRLAVAAFEGPAYRPLLTGYVQRLRQLADRYEKLLAELPPVAI